MIAIEALYQKYLNASGVTTDTRKIEKGNIFFALKGEHFDGNQFAEKALIQGATYAIVDDPEIKTKDEIIVVDNVLETLQKLASYHRKQFNIPVIAITGSNGKTTTKELLASVFGRHYRTHYTKGNFNNHIGVPLTLLSMGSDTEIAVIEMGANHIGEIKILCEIAEPTHGLITNVGKAHLEGFGSFEGVKKAKSELYDFLTTNNGVAFINLDEPFLKDLGEHINHIVYYHRSENPNPKVIFLETKLLKSEPVIEIAFLSDRRDQLVKVRSNLIGFYNFNNIQTAISVGRYFKIPSKKIKLAIESYVPINNRSQLLKVKSNTFILDAYNANPTSMYNALDNLDIMDADSKMVILGDMLELGDYSDEEHQAILNHAVSKSFDKIILVGTRFGEVFKKEERIIQFAAVEELKMWFDKEDIKNTLILLKGSRGIRLEKLLNPETLSF